MGFLIFLDHVGTDHLDILMIEAYSAISLHITLLTAGFLCI